MKCYEIEVLENRVGHAQRLADALHEVFEMNVSDIIAGPNGNPLLLAKTPDDWHFECSFKLWLFEGPGMHSDVREILEPTLVEMEELHGVSGEQYYALIKQENKRLGKWIPGNGN